MLLLSDPACSRVTAWRPLVLASGAVAVTALVPLVVRMPVWAPTALVPLVVRMPAVAPTAAGPCTEPKSMLPIVERDTVGRST